MKPDKVFNVAVVGLGNFGSKIFKTLLSLPEEVFVHSICEKQYVIEKESQGKNVCQDINYICQNPKIDVVFIATPAETHYNLAKKAIESGKHIFLEKPMALSYAQSEDLVRLAREKEVQIHVDNTFLFSPEVVAIKQCLEFNTLGELVSFKSLRANLGPYWDVGVVFDLLCHDVSILNYLFKDDNWLVGVSATAVKTPFTNRIDSCHVSFFNIDGLIFNVDVSYNHPYKVRELIVCGNKAIFSHNSNNNYYKITKRNGESKDVILSQPYDPLTTEIKYFSHCLRTQQTDISSGYEGSHIIGVLEKVMHSINNKGAYIEF